MKWLEHWYVKPEALGSIPGWETASNAMETASNGQPKLLYFCTVQDNKQYVIIIYLYSLRLKTFHKKYTTLSNENTSKVRTKVKTIPVRTFTASGISVTADGCLFTSDAISFGIVVFSLNLNKEILGLGIRL